MNIERLTDRVLLEIGETPEMCLAIGQGIDPEATLRRRIAEMIPGAVAGVVSSLPVDEIPVWKSYTASVAVSDDGRGTVVLPDSCLRIHSIRVSSWERPVMRIHGSDHWLRGLQTSRWHGLRGTVSRPVVFRTVKDGKPALELVPAADGDTLAEFWYVEYPEAGDDGEIEVPGSAVAEVVKSVVDGL